MEQLLHTLVIPLVYYAFHSLLVVPDIKEAVMRNMSMGPQSFRGFYALASTLGLVMAVVLTYNEPFRVFLMPSLAGKLGGGLLILAGALGAWSAFRAYSFRAFIGFSPEPKAALVTTGWQARMRHPLYFFTLLMAAGLFLYQTDTRTLAWLLATLIYVPMGAWLEERKLVAIHGDAYRTYQKTTPMLFPKMKKP